MIKNAKGKVSEGMSLKATVSVDIKASEPFDDIETLARKVFYSEAEILGVQETIDRMKDMTYLDVELEHEVAKESGKPISSLSTEAKRKIEVKARLSTNREYQEKLAELQALKEDKTISDFRLSALKRFFIVEFCQNIRAF